MRGSSSSPALASSFMSVLSLADGVDAALMLIGFVGAMGDGMSTPLLFLIATKVLNDLSTSPGAAADPSAGVTFSNKIRISVEYLLFLAMASLIMCFLEAYCWTRTAERQASRMRARYLRAVIRQDVEYFDLNVSSMSDVVTGISNDSLVIQDALGEKLPNFVMNTAMFFGCYAVGFILLWRLTLAALPTAALLVVPGFLYGHRLISLSRKVRAEYVKAGSIAEQAVSAVRTVYSFTGEARTAARFSAALEESMRLGMKQSLAKGIAVGMNGIAFGIYAFMVWYGSRLVIRHGALGGTVYAVFASVIWGGLAFGKALTNLRPFSEAAAAAERIMRVVRRVPEIDSESSQGEELEIVSGEVELRKVAFAYPSRPQDPVFEEFSLRIPAGKMVALVGSSGSGKSTVIALLQRFYDPSAGEVMLDGVDIRRLRLKWLRAQMGLVSQEPVLFATSVKENILFGKEDATMEEVITAATAANAHDFISQLPDGYETQVGERGVQMSGGQKQRIAIARAVIKLPKILLLDEATSALDSESERVVQEALDIAAVGRTTIVVAHRLSTIRHADTIAVVQDGFVRELGSHEELITDPNGIYSSLVQMQQSTTGVGHGHAAEHEIKIHCPPNEEKVTGDAKEANKNGIGKSAPPPVPSFRRLLMLNAPEWKQAVLGSVSAIAAGSIEPLYAVFMGSVIAAYFLKDRNEIEQKTRETAFIFAGLAVLAVVTSVVKHYSFGAMGEQLTRRVREQMLAKILTFEVAWFDSDGNSTGAVCSRIATEANVVRSLVGDRTSLMIQTASAVTIACVVGLAISWRLALVMIAVQPLIMLGTYMRQVLLRNMSKVALQAQEESSKLAAEAVSNVRTVTAYSSQDRLLSMFETAQEGTREESRRQSWYAGIALGMSTSISLCTSALQFWYSGKLVAEGRLSTEAFFQTFLVLSRTGRTLAETGAMATDVAKGASAVASVFSVLDRETLIDPDDPAGFKPEKLDGDVEFRDVDFAYPSRPDVVVFKGFSLSIDAGKTTALVGQSGSGKSTVIGLIERFYDPVKGSVRVDGMDIKSYNLRALRRHIGLVSQEPTLFSGTIRDNIMYGSEEGAATEAEMEEAARAANAHDFISSLKEGYDALCGEQGVQLSGGQKQRIAIARAILKNPAILLLDEATSALDSQSEKVVQEALERVMVGRTTVVVAHRLTTVQGSDVIAVLEKGVVVEKGTHAALMAKDDSVYRGLAALQQG